MIADPFARARRGRHGPPAGPVDARGRPHGPRACSTRVTPPRPPHRRRRPRRGAASRYLCRGRRRPGRPGISAPRTPRPARSLHRFTRSDGHVDLMAPDNRAVRLRVATSPQRCPSRSGQPHAVREPRASPARRRHVVRLRAVHRVQLSKSMRPPSNILVAALNSPTPGRTRTPPFAGSPSGRS